MEGKQEGREGGRTREVVGLRVRVWGRGDLSSGLDFLDDLWGVPSLIGH